MIYTLQLNRVIKMNYKDYKNTRDLVWEILIRERIRELPISVSKLCHSMGIPMLLDKFEDGER